MTLYHGLIAALWLLFILVWIVMAPSAKKNLGQGRWWRGAGLRALVIVALVLIVRQPEVRALIRSARAYFYITDPLAGVVGVLICACGVGLAIWARIYLGRNWGMPMSHKQDPELVTGGPYAYVRHPIYAGVILIVLGSAIAVSILWLLPLVPATPYFIYSARSEEKLMLEQFPQAYRAYMSRTKMLLPFIL